MGSFKICKDAELCGASYQMESFKICKDAELCGGCSYQGVPYEEQLKNKQGEVRGLLEKAGFDPGLLSGIVPCSRQRHYRNKMEYTFGNAFKGGPTLLGLHKRRSYMSIVQTDECMLAPEDFNKILIATLDYVRQKGYSHYNKKLRRGLMRALIVRKGFRTNQLLIIISTTSQGVFDKEGYVKHIMSLGLDDTVVGILHNIDDNISDTISSEELRVLYGRSWYEEEILGLKFKVGAFSFFQSNVDAAERLYADAISLIDGLEGKTVYDLYCGTGTITQAMAKKAKKAIGVEIVPESVETARASAKLNGLSNCEFIAGDVAKVLSSIDEKPDVIVVDPPRSGIVPKALSQILSYGVEQIIYISCNPKTMIENLRAARLLGYEALTIKAYDNFPYTKHVECVTLMSRVEK
jgi:23S rRNA (uracil1939-C5)-methyltransferase